MRATSANKIPPATGGFTLLEIIIALTLVAILVTASLPYLFDSFAASAGDRAMESITNQAQETRRQAIEKGESRRLKVTSGGLEGVALPAGWSLEMKGLNDSKFHPPLRDQVWEFSSEGIC
ncbi:MAG: type II secretion system protein [bacterium]